jgi:hypothetical protein
MAADGLFFQIFARVHPQTQVPVVGILVFGVLMAFLALLLDLEALVQFLSIGTLLAYTFVAASIIILRFQKASLPSSPGPASPVPTTKKYQSFSDHIQLVGADQPSSPEPGQLRPALRPYLGFLGGCSPGAAVTWALGILVASTIILGCVLVFGDSALHLPRWTYTLLLVISGVMFLLSLLVLGAHQQQQQRDTFQVPPQANVCSLSPTGSLCPASLPSQNEPEFMGLPIHPLLPPLSFCMVRVQCLTRFGDRERMDRISVRSGNSPEAQITLSLHSQIPLVPLTPALSILLNICLMLKLSYLTWLRFAIWLLIGKWNRAGTLRVLQREDKEGRQGWDLALSLMPPLQD